MAPYILWTSARRVVSLLCSKSDDSPPRPKKNVCWKPPESGPFLYFQLILFLFVEPSFCACLRSSMSSPCHSQATNRLDTFHSPSGLFEGVCRGARRIWCRTTGSSGGGPLAGWFVSYQRMGGYDFGFLDSVKHGEGVGVDS